MERIIGVSARRAPHHIQTPGIPIVPSSVDNNPVQSPGKSINQQL
jgi:hypothetical protein